jgi:16S rRNA (uracil1498-N3)-methyltransferase
MRAIFLEDINKSHAIEDDEAHHLINVVRIQIGEEILLLNGMGAKILAKVVGLEKNRVNFEVIESLQLEKTDKFHLAIGLPKKDAFEEVLRNSTELGISNILYFKSQFSQQDFVFNERIKRVLVSSLIQSNNPHFPSLEKVTDLNALIKKFSQYDKVIYFCSHTKIPSGIELDLREKDKILLIIGPEGGFSAEEEDLLTQNNLVNTQHLPSFILRAPTAVVAAMGWVMGKLS